MYIHNSDLGMSREEQVQAFDKVAAAAEAVWTDACEGVDVERQALRDRVSHCRGDFTLHDAQAGCSACAEQAMRAWAMLPAILSSMQKRSQQASFPCAGCRHAAWQVEKDLTEAIKIREALGDDEADLELSQCKVWPSAIASK